MAKYITLKGALLWSEDYKKLANWYIEKFGFEIDPEFTFEHPEDTGISLVVGDSYIWCGKHSEVHGLSKDPYRIMFNINVDAVVPLYEELVAKGVEFVAPPFTAPTMNKTFATFKDIDGNIGQIVSAN